jgi:hypothetical protein
MTSDIALSVRLQVSGRLAHSRASRRPASQLQLADTPRKCSWQSPRDDPTASNQLKATQSRRIRHVLRQRGNSPGSSQRIIHLQHLGHSQAEDRPRRCEAFLRLAIVLQRGEALSTASLSPGRAAVRGGDGTTTRQIARRSGCCRARNSANARRTCEGIRITAAQQHRSCRGDRGFWLKLPRTSLARSFSAAAWPIRGAWWDGVGF